MGRKPSVNLADQSPRWAAYKHAFALLSAMLCVLLVAIAQPAAAQTVTRYTNTAASATNAISDTTTPCTTAGTMKKTFTVGTAYTVSDVNIGVLIGHTYRGDIGLYLTSPAGTRIQLKTSDNTNNAQNFNNLLDDQASSSVTAYTAAASITTVPPYSSTSRPTTGLSAFNGQSSAGTWTLEICDALAADSGTYYQADLYLTQAPSSYADLSLSMSASTTSPAAGGSVTYTLTVTNAATSPTSASGVVVRDLLPAGMTYASYSGFGTYNSATGDWTVGTLTPGQSRTISITATVSATAGASILNSAEVTASSVIDIDSTVNNGSTGEDDYASATVTVAGTRTAGTPPVLTCTAGTSVFDWDTQAWTAGSTSNSYTLSGIGSVAFNIANQGVFLNNATYGGQSPAKQTAVTGGLATPQNSLAQLVDLPNQSSYATTTIALGTAVPGLQFQIFDVDFASGQFADKVTVTGSLGGTAVTPTLTNGIANYVIGNTAYGDALSSDTQANGNITVTFSSAVDTITIAYGDHALAPVDPGQQGIEIFDITFCKPTASIGVTKVSSIISDPVNGATNPKAIPGAVIEYCILISNTGTSTVTSVSASDALPATFTYAAGTMLSGTTCSGAATTEDDNNTGTDETDPFGAAISGTTLTATASSLGPSQSFALKFRGTIK